MFCYFNFFEYNFITIINSNNFFLVNSNFSKKVSNNILEIINGNDEISDERYSIFLYKINVDPRFSLFLPPWFFFSESNKKINSKFCIKCIQKANIKGNKLFVMYPPFYKTCSAYLSEIIVELNKEKYIGFDV